MLQAAAFFCGQPQKRLLLFFKPHRCHSSLSLAPQTKSRHQAGRAFDASRDAGRLPRHRQERILHPDEIPPPRTDPASRRNRMAWGREDSSPEYIAGGSIISGDAEGRYSTRRIVKSNCRTFASMYTQQGLKGVNQDAMVLWEVAGHVSKNLPSKLSLLLKQPSFPEGNKGDGDLRSNTSSASHEAGKHYSGIWLSSWKKTFTNAFEELDNELSTNTSFDCICSGTSVVSIVKLREHLLVANLGDSRAILGTRNEKNMLVPVQLTVDQKPNLPGEIERIKSCKGRVFALKEDQKFHSLILWVKIRNIV
ncbi:putative protein phosphatase 2C 73 [Platanthera guangdongensis]|uniref:protein-serine/threonine phosphatase n=1 Tax=Platanthera guangdongensis TaxID=2320717 RepID=A0ABR2LEX1_9ASPA